MDDLETPKRPSEPPPSAKMCRDCKRIKDDSGCTFGWGLCHCGSFRLPETVSALPCDLSS